MDSRSMTRCLGQVNNRQYCQEFPLGRGHSIAFLERNPSHANNTAIFIPSDFTEMSYEGNITGDLLLATCGLQRLVPLESSAMLVDVCPRVSTASQCFKTVNITTTSKTSS
jgi:hypothetical protein